MYGNRHVCEYFLRGRCKYGDRCKNEHPSDDQNRNRFSLLSTQQPRGRSGAFGGSNGQTEEANTYSITAEAIKLELTEERPIWPLSCYGPGRNAPRQLLDAEFEQSPEEMRVLHYIAVANGNTQDSAQRESSTAKAVNQAIQKILSNPDAAVKYILDGKDQHPNRIDMVKQPFSSDLSQVPSAFGAAQTTAPASTFGQPSGITRNTQSSTFGQLSVPSQTSSFGQPSSLGSTAFGQPSGLVQNASLGTTSAFGAASGFGKPSFGQPSQPSGFAQAAQSGQSGFNTASPFAAQKASFGQPSALGTGTTQQTSFGQPSALGQTSFGQASALGSGNTQQTSFGQPSALGMSNTQQTSFGQASTFGAAANKPSPFAAAANGAQGQPSPFASAANNAPQQQSSSAFGQPSALGAAANKISPFASLANGTTNSQVSGTFGQPSGVTTTSPFAAQQTQTASLFAPFGAAQQNGASAAPQSTFAQPSATTNVSPFGAAQQKGSSAASQSTFGQPSAPTTVSPFAAAAQRTNNTITTSTAQPSPHLSRDASGRLTAFKGRQVLYDTTKKTYTARNPETGNQERIWFPDGVSLPHKDAQASEETYQGELGAILAKLYLYVKEHGVFENGIMPEIPPKCEWVAFDI